MADSEPADRPSPLPIRSLPGWHAPPAPVAPLRPPLTPLVGREQESEAICSLLVQDNVRLVTLTGPGGIGKTRLALRVADLLAPHFPGGVVTVALASIRDPRFVLPTVAQALGLQEAGGQSPADAIAASLNNRRILLVLDNLEQIPDVAPDIANLLVISPTLKILATSRALLRISGEHDFPVPPLQLSDPGRPPSLEELAVSEAGQLFMIRARAARPNFVLSDETSRAVATICRRVDCLPLAIELAAARLRHLPLESLVARLEQRLPLLVGGDRDQPDRLRTMRDAIAWSYDLLAPEEQVAFRRLAVFAGGFGVEAAAAVTQLRDETTTLDVIGSLIDKSLVRPFNNMPTGEARFSMLATLREFGFEQLAMNGEEVEVRTQHAEWYLDLAEQARPALEARVDQGHWLHRLEAERDNIRAALIWLLDTHHSEGALRLSGSLYWFWFIRGPVAEGRMWLDRTLASARSEAPALDRARALQGAALLAHIQGEDAVAEQLADEARILWDGLGDSWGSAEASLYRAVIATARDQIDEAARFCEEALAHSRIAGHHANEAMALHFLGVTFWGQGDHERAVTLGKEALALQRAIHDPWGEANSLAYLGLIVGQMGDHRHALDLLQQSLSIRRDIGGSEELLGCLVNFAALAAAVNEPTLAARLFGAADAVRMGLGSERRSLPERHILEEAIGATRVSLGDKAFRAAWEEGYHLTLEQALDLALSLNIASTPPVPVAPGHPDRLTERELEVLRLVAHGNTNTQIADQLFISPGTARNHVANILGKLGARTRTEAANIGRRRGLI